MPEVTQQKHLIHELDNQDGSSWLIMLDAGRCDIFEDIYEEYFSDAEYQRVYNGGWSATPYWFNDIFKYPVEGFLFHGGQKIKNIFPGVDYDEDECFEHVPNPMLYDSYEGGTGDVSFRTPDPASVNDVVEQHLPARENTVEQRLKHLGYKESASNSTSEPVSMNVVRYLQPHAPYRSLDDINDHRSDIRNGVKDGTLSRQEWIDAYTDNYHWGMEYAQELVETLIDWGADNIVITSDHGECFGDCGDWFHGDSATKENGEYHTHLVMVPWLRVH